MVVLVFLMFDPGLVAFLFKMWHPWCLAAAGDIGNAKDFAL